MDDILEAAWTSCPDCGKAGYTDLREFSQRFAEQVDKATSEVEDIQFFTMQNTDIGICAGEAPSHLGTIRKQYGR